MRAAVFFALLFGATARQAPSYGADSYETPGEECELMKQTILYMNAIQQDTHPMWNSATEVTRPMLEAQINASIDALANIAIFGGCELD